MGTTRKEGGLSINKPSNLRTKIVATIGPACDQYETLAAMADAGVKIFRINLSHGGEGRLARYFKLLCQLRNDRERANRTTFGILLDTRGPELRIGGLSPEGVSLKDGDHFEVELTSHSHQPFIAAPWLVEQLRPGQEVLLDDGNLLFTVSEIDPGIGGRPPRVNFLVRSGGVLLPRKRISLPEIDMPLPILSEDDIQDLRSVDPQELDFVALSFVRKRRDVEEAKSFLSEIGCSAQCISKIESRLALERISEILDVTDGIMVARGDLGLELPAEQVPAAQKQLLRFANEAAVPSITATQMLESMIQHHRPTRAEVTDVYNAILDGSDAVMLSGETAMGHDPVGVVSTMAKVASEAEAALAEYGSPTLSARVDVISATRPFSAAISQASHFAARDLGAVAILTPTETGATARRVARHRPTMPIIAYCTQRKTMRQLSLVWGVESELVERAGSLDELIETGLRIAGERGLEKGAPVVITAGAPLGRPGTTNMMRIERLPDR